MRITIFCNCSLLISGIWQKLGAMITLSFSLVVLWKRIGSVSGISEIVETFLSNFAIFFISVTISIGILTVMKRDVSIFWVWGTTSVLWIITVSIVITRKVFCQKIEEMENYKVSIRIWAGFFFKNWAEVFRGDFEKRWILKTCCLLKQLEFLGFVTKPTFFGNSVFFWKINEIGSNLVQVVGHLFKLFTFWCFQ